MDRKKMMAIFIVLFMSFFAYVVPDYGFSNDLNVKSNLEYKTSKNNKSDAEVLMYINGIEGENNSSDQIIIDDEKPEIKLNGANIILRINDEYEELGATAYDNIDGDITENIVINGDVKNEIGSYELEYLVEDKSGNENSIIREVNVVDDINLYENIKESINIVKKYYKSSLIDNLIAAIEIYNDKKSTQEIIDKVNNALEQEILNYKQNKEIRSCFINKKTYIYQKHKNIYS